ncbi:hypothetical protein D3C76_979560 [compost metagenome]
MGVQRQDRPHANFLQGQVDEDKLQHIAQLQDDDIARHQACIQQVQTQARGNLVKLGVAHLTGRIAHGNALAVLAAHRLEGIRQGLVLPVALGAILLNELFWKRHESHHGNVLDVVVIVGRNTQGPERNSRPEELALKNQVVLAKPPSMTMVSPVTKCMCSIRVSTTSATSGMVTQRCRGVARARRLINLS